VATPDARDPSQAGDLAVDLPAGWSLRYAPVVGSTQDLARAAADAGVADGTIFLADYQTAGRGRHGRRWLAAPGSALTLSILFRDARPEPAPRLFTTMVAVALAGAIEEMVPTLRPRIKWPNDVMLGTRKVAGVLAEAQWNGAALAIVVGLGVNVNCTAAELAGVGNSATSLLLEGGRPVHRGHLLTALVRALERARSLPAAALHAAWQARLWGRGQRLRLTDLALDEEVVVLGVDEDGALRVRLADGRLRRTVTGELIV